MGDVELVVLMEPKEPAGGGGGGILGIREVLGSFVDLKETWYF